MTHGHDHDHHHIESPLSFDEKMVKLIEHWIKHNADHALTYKQWAERANENHHADVSGLLMDAAEITMEIDAKLKEALEILT